MLKTISAALLAVSVIAAPALAANSGKSAQTPAPKTTASDIKSKQTKPSALNANAKMNHHREHVRHHRSHKKMTSLKTHKVSKVSGKQAAPTGKRG